MVGRITRSTHEKKYHLPLFKDYEDQRKICIVRSIFLCLFVFQFTQYLAQPSVKTVIINYLKPVSYKYSITFVKNKIKQVSLLESQFFFYFYSNRNHKMMYCQSKDAHKQILVIVLALAFLQQQRSDMRYTRTVHRQHTLCYMQCLSVSQASLPFWARLCTAQG